MSKRKARAPPPAGVKRAATEPPEARGEWKAFFYLSTMRRREENSDKVDDHGFEDDYPIPATEPFDEEADRSKLKKALVRSLRAELKKRGADASGDKAALTERLLPLRAQAAEQAEADRSRDTWWDGESLIGFTPGTESPVAPDKVQSLPSVTFTADGQTGIIHPGRSELDHLEGALRRVSPPTTDGFYTDPWDLFENGLELYGMDTRPSKRPKPICAYEWRPRGDTAWLPMSKPYGRPAWPQEADWPRLNASRRRLGQPLALVKPARRHSGQTLVGLVFVIGGFRHVWSGRRPPNPTVGRAVPSTSATFQHRASRCACSCLRAARLSSGRKRLRVPKPSTGTSSEETARVAKLS